MDAVEKATKEAKPRLPQDSPPRTRFHQSALAYVRLSSSASGVMDDGEQIVLLAGTTGRVLMEECDSWPSSLWVQVTLAFGKQGPIRDVRAKLSMRHCTLDWLRPVG